LKLIIGIEIDRVKILYIIWIRKNVCMYSACYGYIIWFLDL